MLQTIDKTVGEWVTEDYRLASVFEKYGIDFCCRGNRSLGEACARKKIPVKDVMEDIDKATASAVDGTADYRSWPLDLLADYIEKKHHRYVNEKIPVLTKYLDKLVRVHGAKHPELQDINMLFEASAEALFAHMKKEENILFPYVRQMVEARQRGEKPSSPPFETVERPIAVMIREHENEGERLRKIRDLTHDYTPPKQACATFQAAYALLKEFEKDLHLHIHLENNILFPDAKKLEDTLNA